MTQPVSQIPFKGDGGMGDASSTSDLKNRQSDTACQVVECEITEAEGICTQPPFLNILKITMYIFAH